MTFPAAAQRVEGVALVTSCFAAWELATAIVRGNLDASWVYGAGASAAALGVLFGAITLLLGARELLHARAVGSRFGLVLGALDGAVLWQLVIVMQWYETFRPTEPVSWGTFVLFTISGAVTAYVLPNRPRSGLFIALIAALIAAFGLAYFPPRELLFLRIALLFVLFAGGSRIVAPLLHGSASRVLTTFLVAAFACSGGWLTLTSSSHVRALTYQALPATWTLVRGFVRTFPGSFPRRPQKIGRRCSDVSRDQEPEISSQGSPSLPEIDLLILTIDAWRWDDTLAMKEALAALGPHVQFTRALTPATHTMFALASVFRGVPMREVPFGRTWGMPAPKANASPSLGDLLANAGYRAVSIPTHRFFDPKLRLAPGFEIVRVDDRPVFQGDPGGGRAVVRHPDVLWRALKVAERTKTPLALWAHLMDAHAPYRYGNRTGPQTHKGQRRALRSLSTGIAAFLPRFRALRRPRPLIVALLGDHGEEFLEHGGTHHGSSAFAELARVGFALSAPGLSSARIDAPVSTASLTPTLLDLVGVAPHPRMSMPSLLPCLGRDHDCPTIARTEQHGDEGSTSYTTRTHRLVVNSVYGIEMLFDTERDPYDQRDLTQSQKDAVLQELRGMAQAFDDRHCEARDSL